jgi:hypothetical protein
MLSMSDIATTPTSFTPPAPPAPAPPPPAPPPPPAREQTVLRECAICQSSIYPSEATHPCPKCGLIFHTECWHENYGCATYGCDQVNALAPKIDIPAAAVDLPPPIDMPVEPIPWDFVLLGGAALAMVASMLSYGFPSLLTIAGIGWRMHRKNAWRNRILITASVLCVVGIIGGIALSRFWFTQIDYAGGALVDADAG